MNRRTKLKIGRPSKPLSEKLTDELHDEDPMTQITTRLPVSLHSKLKIYAANKRTSIMDCVLKQIEKMLNEEDK